MRVFLRAEFKALSNPWFHLDFELKIILLLIIITFSDTIIILILLNKLFLLIVFDCVKSRLR